MWQVVPQGTRVHERHPRDAAQHALQQLPLRLRALMLRRPGSGRGRGRRPHDDSQADHATPGSLCAAVAGILTRLLLDQAAGRATPSKSGTLHCLSSTVTDAPSWTDIATHVAAGNRGFRSCGLWPLKSGLARTEVGAGPHPPNSSGISTSSAGSVHVESCTISGGSPMDFPSALDSAMAIVAHLPQRSAP